MDKESAAKAKEAGNREFSAKNYAEAVKHFTEAIQHDATDHVFYSNRSACYASLGQYQEALADGTKCVELKPDWVRGYTRKALAEFYLGAPGKPADMEKMAAGTPQAMASRLMMPKGS